MLNQSKENVLLQLENNEQCFCLFSDITDQTLTESSFIYICAFWPIFEKRMSFKCNVIIIIIIILASSSMS